MITVITQNLSLCCRGWHPLGCWFDSNSFTRGVAEACTSMGMGLSCCSDYVLWWWCILKSSKVSAMNLTSKCTDVERRCRAICRGNLSKWSYAFCISHRMVLEFLAFAFILYVLHVWKVPNCQLPEGLQDQLCKVEVKVLLLNCWVHWNLNLWFIHCFGRLPDPTWRPLVVRNLSNPSVLAVDEQNKRLKNKVLREVMTFWSSKIRT